MATDFKKTDKHLYGASRRPEIFDVPEMVFVAVDGRGDPNTSPRYAAALAALYAVAYTVKMSKMTAVQPAGYFDFVVPPLEGLWTSDAGPYVTGVTDKASFVWTAMIRLPEFVTDEVFGQVLTQVAAKKPEVDTSVARRWVHSEGLCAQILHTGPYDDEPATVHTLESFVTESGHRTDLAGGRRHHEIYLADPRRTAPEKLRTIIRVPIV